MNARFWRECSDKYHAYFERPDLRILEVGSCYVNGSVRNYLDLSKCVEYIGVDWRPGLNVDHVCLAHDMNFGRCFDVVLSSSMLEHDPFWQLSIPAMLRHLKEDGILLLSWGAARNPSHEEYTAPDGLFHSLPASKVLDLLGSDLMYVHEFLYEGNHFREGLGIPEGIGLGEVCLVAFTDPKYAIGEARIDPLLPEDQ